MDTSQASTFNNCDNKLYLKDKEISFLLAISEKSKNINFVGQSKLKNIYEDIDYACSHNIEFNSVETDKNKNIVHIIIKEYEDIEEEVSEGIILGYITKKDHPKSFEKLSEYRIFLEERKRLKDINIIRNTELNQPN